MKKCALVIGHKKASSGAVNKESGVSEFEFNDRLSVDIESNIEDVTVQRIYRRTYQELPGDINAYEPDFIISLHCNAYDKNTSGTEVLYYHRSMPSKKIAEILLKHLVEGLNLPNRGIKARNSEDRGGYLLRYTAAPCIIAEPFFIDNDDDYRIALENREKLINSYVNAISEISREL
jgi:N-acetylmuramoyl-L-alanine amidase